MGTTNVVEDALAPVHGGFRGERCRDDVPVPHQAAIAFDLPGRASDAADLTGPDLPDWADANIRGLDRPGDGRWPGIARRGDYRRYGEG